MWADEEAMLFDYLSELPNVGKLELYPVIGWSTLKIPVRQLKWKDMAKVRLKFGSGLKLSRWLTVNLAGYREEQPLELRGWRLKSSWARCSGWQWIARSMRFPRGRIRRGRGRSIR